MYTKHVKTKFLLALLFCFMLCLVNLPVSVAAESELNFRWILPPEFYRGNDFHNDRAWVQREQGDPWTLFDSEGNIIKDGFMARNVIQSSLSDTRFIAIEQDSETGLDMFGVLDDYSGDILLAPNPHRPGQGSLFQDGIAWQRGENDLWGFIDFEGRWVIPPIYENFFFIEDGLMPAQKNGMWGIINKNEEVVIDFRFEELRIFENGLFVALYGELYGLVNINGEWITEAIYERFFRPHSPSHLIAAQKDGKVGYLDENGNVVIDFRFAGVEGTRRAVDINIGRFAFSNGGAAVQLPAEGNLPVRWAVINESGDIVPTEQFDLIWPFHDGLAPAVRDNRWFILDVEGNEYPLPSEFVWGEVEVRSNYGNIFRAHFEREGRTGYFRVRD